MSGGNEPKVRSEKLPPKTGNQKEDDKRRVENINLSEANPAFFADNNEMSWENRHNASVVLTKDRGRKKETNAGAIDISVGKIDNINKKGSTAVSLQKDANAKVKSIEGASQPFSTGDLQRDAARIYISEKTDIDNLFKIPGKLNSVARSGIAIKADAVRVISRDAAGGIKLITAPELVNSKNGDAAGNSGVQMIGSRDDSMLQSMVKASDLATFLGAFMQVVVDLKNLVYEFQTTQKDFNRRVGTSVGGISPFYGASVVVDPSVTQQMSKTSLELFNKVENDTRSIEAKISDLTSQLGLMDIGDTADVDFSNDENAQSTQLTVIDEPVFASKFHKLD